MSNLLVSNIFPFDAISKADKSDSLLAILEFLVLSISN